MASSPGYAVVGVSAVGFGFLLIYGGYKNVPILGKDGILSQAISTGKLVSPAPHKESFSPGGIVEDNNFKSIKDTAATAVGHIAEKQPTLAAHLQAEIDASEQEGAATGTLVSLIKMADNVGFHDDAAALQAYADQVGRPVSGVM